MKKKLLTLIIISFFVFSSLGIAENINQENKSEENQVLKKSNVNWTVMYYICGDDEKMDYYIDPLLENLSKIGSTYDFNIVSLVDRVGYGNSNIYYFEENGSKIDLNNEFDWPEEIDMSNSVILERFCNKVIDFFPSEHYALITYADGGTGWQRYLLNDEDGRGYLTIPEFAECLKKITCDGKCRLDVLQTSCCMSNIEVTYEFAPYVKYLITTQEHISHNYWVKRFYQAIWDLRNDSSLSPVAFAKRTAFRHEPHTYQGHEAYGCKLCFLTKIFNKLPFPQLHTVQMHSSVSIVNLSLIDEVKKEIQNLTELLILHLEEKKLINIISKVRAKTREYGKGLPRYLVPPIIYMKLPIEILSYNCRIDLYHLVQLLKENVDNSNIENYCNSVMNFINESIVVIKKVENDSSNGLSIYFPEKKIGYNKDIKGGKNIFPYEDLKFSEDTKWDEFVKIYLKI